MYVCRSMDRLHSIGLDQIRLDWIRLQMDRQIDRQTDRQIDRDIDIDVDVDVDIDIQTHTHTLTTYDIHIM